MFPSHDREEWLAKFDDKQIMMAARMFLEWLYYLPDDWHPKDYAHWIEHLINYRMWETWDCVANELRMVDRKRDIAGSCDVILQHKDTGMLCLADFKTQEVYKKKNHRLQMGGYVSLLYQNYPSVDLWSCRVIYITPDGIKTQDYNPQECMYDYEEARTLYFSKQVKF